MIEKILEITRKLNIYLKLNWKMCYNWVKGKVSV